MPHVVCRLESQLKTQFNNWCIKHGYFHIPMTGVMMSGVPDTLLIKNGNFIFIEFKRAAERTKKNGGLSEIQKHIIEKLRCHGARVEVIYDKKEFEKL